MEGMIGKSWSVESWGGFTQMMAWYREMLDACRGPKLAIFAQDNLADGDYRGMRYGLGATLMDDGYYYVNDSTGYTPDHMKCSTNSTSIWATLCRRGAMQRGRKACGGATSNTGSCSSIPRATARRPWTSVAPSAS